MWASICYTPICVYRSKDNLWESILSFTMWVPGIEHRSSDLQASAFAHLVGHLFGVEGEWNLI